jgi:hypothetical protein
MKPEHAFESRRFEVALEKMRAEGDIDSLFQMALQANKWAWALKSQLDFVERDSLRRIQAEMQPPQRSVPDLCSGLSGDP